MRYQNSTILQDQVDVIDLDCFSCQTGSPIVEEDGRVLRFDGVGLARLAASQCPSCGTLELLAVFRPGATMPNLPAAFKFIQEFLVLAQDRQPGKRH